MSEQQPFVNLTIDGTPIRVPKGTTVYNAAKNLGIEIPIFCYQDRMPPFGACRMCLVEVEKMAKPQASCVLEATEGMVVKTQTAMAIEARESILEFLLINHPLDCPICDRGGECPLQDQTLRYGPGLSRFFEEKRRFKKPIPLGPVLMLDRERCVVCARCTRFGDLIAGDHALEFIERGYRTEVGTPHGGPAESKFIGNTIMICPVGALTSQVYRFRARPWDNQSTPSTCTLCPVGCNMILDSRDGEIMRTRSFENKDLNDIWLCDKGWFGYEFTYHPDRLKKPLIRRNGKLETASWDEALELIAQKIQAAKMDGKLGAIGGNPLTVEENYLFQKLMRTGAHVNNVDHRVGVPLLKIEEEGFPPGMEISIGDCENLTFAALLGVDLTEEFPVIWLRLKQAINKGAKVLFLGHYAPEIAQHLSEVHLHAPGNEIEMIQKHLQNRKGALFIGSQYLNSPNRKAILAEVQKLGNSINVMEGNNNSMGARFAGMHPEHNGQKGLNTLQMLETAAQSGWDFLYVVGANPALKYPDQLWHAAREKLGFLVVQDLFLTETAQQADVVLPTLSFVEKGGSFINIEGRVQKLLPGKEIPSDIYSDSDIFIKLAQKLNIELTLDNKILEKVSFDRPAISTSETSLNQVPLSATFAPALFDHGVRMLHDPHVIQLAKEPCARIHPNEASKLNIQKGDTVQISSNGNSIRAKIKLDKKVAEKTVVLPLGFKEIPVHNLASQLYNGMKIAIERIHA